MTCQEFSDGFNCPGYSYENPCQCNIKCELYNDCCPDYHTWCVEAQCSNYGCIGYNKQHTCQCDSVCRGHQNCCSDYVSFCIENSPDDNDQITITHYASNSVEYTSVLMAVMLLLMVSIIVSCIRLKLCGKSKKQKPIANTSNTDRSVIVCTFISIMFYFLCCLCYLLSSIVLLSININSGFARKSRAEIASTIFWSLGYGFMQLVLVARLYFTFKDTPYAHATCVYIALAVLYLIELAVVIVFHVEFNSKDWDNPLILTCIGAAFVCHVVFLCVVTGLYTNALFKIAVDRSAQLLDDRTNNEEHDAVQRLMDHTTRMAVLTGTAGATTIAAFIIWCVFFAEEGLETDGEAKVTFGLFQVAWWILPMDALVNAICLFLNLPFVYTYNIYSNLCCGCHAVCGSVAYRLSSAAKKSKPEKKGNDIDASGNELTTM